MAFDIQVSKVNDKGAKFTSLDGSLTGAEATKIDILQLCRKKQRLAKMDSTMFTRRPPNSPLLLLLKRD